MRQRALVLGMVFAVMCCAAYAADQKQTPAPNPPAVKPADAAQPAEVKSEDEWVNRWAVVWGLSNIHAKLDDSEYEINKKLNTPLQIVPGYRHPITFEDWSRNFYLWDFHVGVARDFGPLWSAYLSFAYSQGRIGNNTNYWAYVAPLKVRSTYIRKFASITLAGQYYPFKKPVLEQSNKCAIWRSIRSARPFLEVAIGHVNVFESADARLSVPNMFTFFRYVKNMTVNSNYVSPRIGVDIPVGENDSIILRAGYLVFDQHSGDLNDWSYYILHEHRF